MENNILGRQPANNQMATTSIKTLISDCHTKAQTPYPLYAKIKPMIPDTTAAMTEAHACDLKSTAIDLSARGTIPKELTTIVIARTHSISVRIGI